MKTLSESVNISTKVDEDWRKFVHEQKEKDLAEIIDEERLKSEETKKFIDNSFRDGTLKQSVLTLIKLCRQYRALVVEQKRKKALSKS